MKGAVLLLVLALAAPMAQAGTAEEPEISDAVGDVDMYPLPVDGGSPFEQTAALDVVASWIHDETPTEFQVTMQVADLSRVEEFDGPAGSYARWGTRFELSNYVPDTRDDWWNYTWIVNVHLNNGPRGWRASVELPDAGGERGKSVDTEFMRDDEGDRFTVTVPRSALGYPMAGDTMSDLRSLHDGDVAGVSAARLHHNDQSDRGMDYRFTLDSVDSDAPPAPVTSTAAPAKDAPALGALPVVGCLVVLAAVAAARRR